MIVHLLQNSVNHFLIIEIDGAEYSSYLSRFSLFVWRCLSVSIYQAYPRFVTCLFSLKIMIWFEHENYYFSFFSKFTRLCTFYRCLLTEAVLVFKLMSGIFKKPRSYWSKKRFETPIKLIIFSFKLRLASKNTYPLWFNRSLRIVLRKYIYCFLGYSPATVVQFQHLEIWAIRNKIAKEVTMVFLF